jgi:hypothetical protein
MLRTSGCLAATLAVVSLVLAPGCANLSGARVDYATASPEVRAGLADLARRAVGDDARAASAAVTELRAAGPAGLDAMFDVWADRIARLAEDPNAPEVQHLRAAIEGVARQRDAHASHLYWYTDLDEAMRVARAQHKPILSLRLLGNLDEELSCANSRFFRTTLYPNPRIGDLLRQGFVLHWSSERPAPRITIDFGDGRRVERTITGNSIHYVLDEDGEPVDALPGLLGPEAFVRSLGAARAAALGAMRLDGDARRAFVRNYHAQAGAELDAAGAADLGAVGAPVTPLPGAPAPAAPVTAAPSARDAAPLAVSKFGAEGPMVGALQGPVGALAPPVPVPVWSAVLARHASDAHLDTQSRALMRRKMATELDPSGTRLVPLDDATFARKVAAFERSLAEDTLRNELFMHRTLHAWMAEERATTFEDLNRRVYATLFLTPQRDPWLGLVADAYSGIPNEGLVVGRRAR